MNAPDEELPPVPGTFPIRWYLDAVQSLNLHARLVGYDTRPGYKVNPTARTMKVRRWAGGCLVEIPRDIDQETAAVLLASGFVDANDVPGSSPSWAVAVEDAVRVLMPKLDPWACAPLRQILSTPVEVG